MRKAVQHPLCLPISLYVLLHTSLALADETKITPALPSIRRDKHQKMPSHLHAHRSSRRLHHSYLQTLHENERAYLTHDGKIVRNIADADGMFEALGNGEYHFWPGRPSRNGVFIVKPGAWKPVIESTTLTDGDTFSLARAFPVQLVKNGLDANRCAAYWLKTARQQGAEKGLRIKARSLARIMRHLSELSVGSRLTLGRQLDHNLPVEVSRFHCIAERLPDVDVDGQMRRRYRIKDGIEPIDTSYIFDDDLGWKPITGRIRIGPGTRLRHGEGESATEYHFVAPPASREGQHSLGSSHFEGMLAGRQLTLSHFSQSRNHLIKADEDLPENPAFIPEQIDAIADRLRVAISKIIEAHQHTQVKNYQEARERYAEIRDWLGNKSFWRANGFRFEENNFFGYEYKDIARLNEKELYKLAQRVASRSWFLGDALRIYPSHGEIVHRLDELLPEQQRIVTEFDREDVEVALEECSHALQHAFGRLISKKRHLLHHVVQDPTDIYEVDVAAFFREQQVPISKMFLSRYDRDIALERLKGIQTPFEQQRIAELASALRLDEALVIGRSPAHYADPAFKPIYFSIEDRVSDRDAIGDTRRSFRSKQLRRSIRRAHMTIRKSGEGYAVETIDSPYEAAPAWDVADDFGVWRRGPKRYTVRPGHPFRLGGTFQVTLD